MAFAKSAAGLLLRERGSSAGRSENRWWAVIFVFWGLISFVYVNVGLDQVRNGFADTDIATRLVQLRDFWNGQGWYDLTIPRLAPDVGYVSHWSRLLDAALTATYSAFLLFLPPQQAELAMRIGWPLLMLLVAMVSAALIARRLAGSDHVVVLVALLAALALPFRFNVGDIDHHGTQVALLMATWAALAHADRSVAAAFASGLLVTLSMAISLESLPLLVPVSAIVVLLHVLRGRGGGAIVRPHLAGLLAGSLVFLVLTVPPARWFESIACDAYGANWALPVAVMAGLGLLLLRLPLQNRGMMWRAASIAVAAAAGGAVFLTLDPACLKGPFAHMDPGLRPIWLDYVKEVQPVWKADISSVFRAIWAWTASAFLLALLVFWRKRWHAHGRHAPAVAGKPDEQAPAVPVWLVPGYLLSLGLAVLLSARMIRYLPFAEWLAIPLMALSLHVLFSGLKRMATLARIVGAIVAAPLLWVVVFMQAWPMEAAASAEKKQREACLRNVTIDRLRKEPEGVIAAAINMGPYILARTHHSVLFAPYHRLNRSLLDVSRIFAGSLSESRDVLRRRGATHVLLCVGLKAPRTLQGGDPPKGSLWRLLEEGRPPAWLEPVDLGKDTPLRLYRVRLDEAEKTGSAKRERRAEAAPLLRRSIH